MDFEREARLKSISVLVKNSPQKPQQKKCNKSAELIINNPSIIYYIGEDVMARKDLSKTHKIPSRIWLNKQ